MKKRIVGIILVVALMSVYVYLLFYKVDYQPDKSFVLPFEINETKTKSIFFFGYVGCPLVCPVSLSTIDEVTQQLDDEKLQVIFFGLNDTTQAATDQYAKMFGKNFIGIKLKKDDQRKLIESFNVFWSSERKEIRREASHSPYVYFLTKKNNTEWILKNVYTHYPPKKEELFKIYQSL